MASSVRLFVKILLGYITIYGFVLYTWKKPLLPLKKDYLSHYKLEDAPIWSLEEALYYNNQACPPEEVNYDRNAVKENADTWAKITEEQIYFWRTGIKEYLATAKHQGKTQGRGIVMSAGDLAGLQRAGVSISLLRHYGCELPVQIYHYEDEVDKVGTEVIDVLQGLGADVIELDGLKRGTNWKAYQIKAIAIQRCSFDEVLYLDTDSYLAKNPTYLFDAPAYKETGVMLWPDFTKSHPTNPVWRLLGIPCRPQFEGESGQVLFNRFYHQEAMHLAEYFALEHGTYYSFMGGDRDSFRIALLALGKAWAGPARMVATAGIERRLGGHTMMQADHLGNWLFVHANLLKHSSLPRDSLVTWNKLVRVKNDTFTGKLGYGSLEGNEQLGDGVKLEVSSMPSMFTEYSSFRDDEKESVTEAFRQTKLVQEDFKAADDALTYFEHLFFKFGGKRL